jgi:hypothetical protein
MVFGERDYNTNIPIVARATRSAHVVPGGALAPGGVERVRTLDREGERARQSRAERSAYAVPPHACLPVLLTAGTLLVPLLP